MSNELATTGHGSALVLQADQERWSAAQLAALQQMGLADVPQGDLDVFFHVAQRTGLDPFARQIHLIGRKSKRYDREAKRDVYETKYTIQTGIDGYRVTMNRAAKREGDTLEYEDTEWCGRDGVWTDVWVASTPPTAARVTLLKNGRRFTGTAMYSEYVQTYQDKHGQTLPNSMWAKMPAGQLAKCAEALAVRKAYPLDFAALYTDDEMGQADNAPTPEAPAGSGLSRARARRQAPAEPTSPQLDWTSHLAEALRTAVNDLGIADDERIPFLVSIIDRPIEAPQELTEEEAHQVIKHIADIREPETVDAEIVADPETGEVQE